MLYIQYVHVAAAAFQNDCCTEIPLGIYIYTRIVMHLAISVCVCGGGGGGH